MSSQFVNNAVLQAGQPVTIWGSTRKWAGRRFPGRGQGRDQVQLAGVEKIIPVTPDMKEWQVTVPAMKASSEPQTLKVSFTIDGEPVHERVITNIVFGDVWYVAAPDGRFNAPAAKSAGAGADDDTQTPKATGTIFPAASVWPLPPHRNPRFASIWKDAEGFAAALGQRIAAKTGQPVGIVFMQSAGRRRREGCGVETLDRRRGPQPRAELDGGLRTTGEHPSRHQAV